MIPLTPENRLHNKTVGKIQTCNIYTNSQSCDTCVWVNTSSSSSDSSIQIIFLSVQYYKRLVERAHVTRSQRSSQPVTMKAALVIVLVAVCLQLVSCATAPIPPPLPPPVSITTTTPKSWGTKLKDGLVRICYLFVSTNSFIVRFQWPVFIVL